MQAAVAALRAAHDELAALPIDLLTKPELLGVLDELETLSCQLPAQSHRMLARLQAETTAKEMGAKSWRRRVGDPVAHLNHRGRPPARMRQRQLGPRRTLIGEPLDPVLPCTALAQAHGLINREHVKVVREAMDRIPPAVDALTRAQIEADLVRTAIGVGPQGTQGQRRPDAVSARPGRPRTRRHRTRATPRRVDRAAGPDKMTPLKGNLTPEACGDL